MNHLNISAVDLGTHLNNEHYHPYRHHRHHRHFHDKYFITSFDSNTPVLMMIFFMFILLIALAFAKN